MAREYSGKDVQVTFFGRVVACKEIKYKAKQEKKNSYVLGQSTPFATTSKMKEYEGTIVIPQSEFEAIIRSLPAGQDLLDIAPFDIIILYLDPTGLTVPDKLVNVQFTEYEKAMKAEDEMMSISLPINIQNVILNAV